MSLPTWPAGINTGTKLNGWQLAPVPEVAATDMDEGPARRRRRFTAMRYSAQVPMVLTQDEFRLFKAFYANVLQQGAKKFTMPVWDGEARVTATVRFDRDNPYSSAQMTVAALAVQLKLEVFDLPVLDEGAFDFLSQFGVDDAFTWSGGLHVWVNATYPGSLGPY